ncbi:Intracellular exo-alpha-(1-_5)-L-arabinofuranosidase [bioreactor metagenome]|uniref:Intracellular exo-alpha-(1->5)-L-arabinofuranosidase n=1 Tax=bioreactor metagenome TaxID=1076179 RepID=A0A645B6U9_9ZZZZ
MHQVTYTLRDALYVAGIINVMWRNCQQVGIATLAQLVNVLPLVKTNETTAFATTIYYPFVLAAKMGAEFLETKQDSPVFESQEISKNIKAHSSVPYLDVTATRKNDHTLSVLAINRHPENRMELVLEVAGRSIQRISQIESVQGASPLSFNDFSNPNQVGIKQHPVSNPEKLIFPPSSVNYFEIEI